MPGRPHEPPQRRDAPPSVGGRPRERRLAGLVALALLIFYLLIHGGHHYSIDGIVMFQSAKQLFFQHTVVLDPPVKWGGVLARDNTFSIGFTLAYLPALALASPLFHWMPSLRRIPFDAAVAHNPELYGNLAYLLCAWLNPLITALTGSLVFLLARRLGLTPGWAVTAALAFGVASPAAAYARYDFSQPLAGLALTAAVYALLGANRLRSFMAAAGALGAMFFTRPDLAGVIAWIVTWLAVDARRSGWRAAALRSTAVVAILVAAVALYLAANQARFGDWTRTGHRPIAQMFLAKSRPLEGAVGLLLSPAHGLLIFAPLTWLALPGLYRLVRERPAVGVLWTGIVAAEFVFYACYAEWWAGWSWGPRYLVPVLPLLTLAAALWAFRGWQDGVRWRPGLFGGLAALGVVIAWNGILLDFVLYYRWVQNVLGVPQTAATRFELAASPLVTGWRFLGTASPDLLLLRMGEFAGPPGTLAAVLIACVLLGGLGWCAARIRRRLHEDAARDGRVSS